MSEAIPATAKYISLRTFKKDGTAVDTPVWFAVLGEGAERKLIVFTDGTSYKVKRLRRDPRIEVTLCNARGDIFADAWHKGRGRIIEGHAEAPYIARGYAALNAKYGMLMRAGTFFSTLVGRVRRRLILELTLDAPSA